MKYDTKQEKNANWRGDKVGETALHEWVKIHKPKPSLCESCCQEKVLDCANITGQYARDVDDWAWKTPP